MDSVIPAIWALDKICASPKIKAAQQSGKLTVMFDSGIRTGSDIIKAIALGAQESGRPAVTRDGLQVADSEPQCSQQ